MVSGCKFGGGTQHTLIEHTRQILTALFLFFFSFVRAKAIQLKRIGAVGSIETNRRQLVRNRRMLLNRLSRRGDLVLSYHETFPGLGFVAHDGNGGFDLITAPIDELDGNRTLQCQQPPPEIN